MPEARTAARAAILRGKLYIVGGVTPHGLATRAFVFDPVTRAWTTAPGPTPREHLAVAGGWDRLFAPGGREGGPDANVATLEVYSLETGRWDTLAPLPEPHSGGGVTVSAGTLVSVGGETSSDTVRPVYVYVMSENRWYPLPDLPVARHGLAVVDIGGRVHAIGGSPIPDCGYSGLHQYLRVGY